MQRRMKEGFENIAASVPEEEAVTLEEYYRMQQTMLIDSAKDDQQTDSSANWMELGICRDALGRIAMRPFDRKERDRQCAGCPVQPECLEDAINDTNARGDRAGHSQSQIVTMRRKRKAGKQTKQDDWGF